MLRPTTSRIRISSGVGLRFIGFRAIISAQSKYDALVKQGVSPKVAVNVLPQVKVIGLSAYGNDVEANVRVLAFNKSSPLKDESGKRIGFGKCLPAISLNFRKSGRENVHNLVVLRANDEYYPDSQENVYSVIVRELGDRDSKEPIGVVSPDAIAYAHGVTEEEMQLHDKLLGARIEEADAPKKWQKQPTEDKKKALEELLASFTRAYGMRTYSVRAAGICDEARRRLIAKNARAITGWSAPKWSRR